MRCWVYPVVTVLAIFLAYSNCYVGAFVFDDIPSLVDNSDIRSLRTAWQAAFPGEREHITIGGRPVAAVSFALNYAISGSEIWSYRLLNVLIHTSAALLLYGIIRRTLGLDPLRGRFAAHADPLAFVVVLCWALHPLQVASVTYVVQRVESLGGLTILLTLYCWIRAATGGRRLWLAAAVAACAVGMGVKEVVAVTPLLVLIYDRTFLSGTFVAAVRIRPIAYTALACTWLIIGGLLVFSPRAFLLTESETDARLAYLRVQSRAIPHYLRLSIWPTGTVLDYGGPAVGTPPVNDPVEYVPGAMLIGVLLVGSAAALLRRRPVGFAGVWFFLILAPSSSVIAMPLESAAEHRMYLPLAAVWTTLILALYRATHRFPIAVLVAAASAATILGIMTYQRNALFRDLLLLWSNDVAHQPHNTRTQTALGTALAQAGRLDEALQHFYRAIELNPKWADAHHNIGNVLAQQGRLSEAEQAYRRAAEIPPQWFMTRFNLAEVLLQQKRLDEAAEQFHQAIGLEPARPEPYAKLGRIARLQGKSDLAIAMYRKALQIDPTNPTTWNALGIALAEGGRMREAVDAFREALKLRADHEDATVNLERALRELSAVPQSRPSETSPR